MTSALPIANNTSSANTHAASYEAKKARTSAWISLGSGKHEPKLDTAKRLAKVLGIPAAFFYTDGELLAELLLQWNDLTLRHKKALFKQLPGSGPPGQKRARHSEE